MDRRTLDTLLLAGRTACAMVLAGCAATTAPTPRPETAPATGLCTDCRMDGRTADLEQLPADDREAWRRCAEIIGPRLCVDVPSRAECLGAMRGTYVGQEGRSNRRAFLVAQGCPHDVAFPDPVR